MLAGLSRAPAGAAATVLLLWQSIRGLLAMLISTSRVHSRVFSSIICFVCGIGKHQC